MTIPLSFGSQCLAVLIFGLAASIASPAAKDLDSDLAILDNGESSGLQKVLAARRLIEHADEPRVGLSLANNLNTPIYASPFASLDSQLETMHFPPIARMVSTAAKVEPIWIETALGSAHPSLLNAWKRTFEQFAARGLSLELLEHSTPSSPLEQANKDAILEAIKDRNREPEIVESEVLLAERRDMIVNQVQQWQASWDREMSTLGTQNAPPNEPESVQAAPDPPTQLLEAPSTSNQTPVKQIRNPTPLLQAQTSASDVITPTQYLLWTLAVLASLGAIAFVFKRKSE